MSDLGTIICSEKEGFSMKTTKPSMLLLMVCVVFFATLVNGDALQNADKHKHGPFTPRIINRLVLAGQTSFIPQTTLFVPIESSLFRISVYAETTASGGSGTLCGSLFWVDDGGGTEIATNLLAGALGFSPQCLDLSSTRVAGYSSSTFTIRATAQTPVQYETHFSVPPSSSVQYSLFITVEQL